MTSRVWKTPLDPTYARGKSEAACEHVPEAHVTYDRLAAGYRAGAWCGCRKVTVHGRRLYETVKAAEDAGAAMLDALIPDRAR